MPVKNKKTSNKSKPNARLSGDARRRQILVAAVPLFAQEGFRGVTTKRLAQCAKVSEALLYQHFPSKEALYEEVQRFCCNPPERLRQMLADLKPSTETLVLLLFLLSKMVIERIDLSGMDNLFPRLMLNSILDDGVFARMHVERTVTRLAAMMQSCFVAARAAGDMLADDIPDDLRFWFCHHTLVTTNMFRMPEPPVVAYPATGSTLTAHAMAFLLRGIGLKSQAIERYNDYQRLNHTVEGWLRQGEG